MKVVEKIISNQILSIEMLKTLFILFQKVKKEKYWEYKKTIVPVNI